MNRLKYFALFLLLLSMAEAAQKKTRSHQRKGKKVHSVKKRQKVKKEEKKGKEARKLDGFEPDPDNYIDVNKLLKDLGVTVGILGWTHHEYKNQLADEKIAELREQEKFIVAQRELLGQEIIEYQKMYSKLAKTAVLGRRLMDEMTFKMQEAIRQVE